MCEVHLELCWSDSLVSRSGASTFARAAALRYVPRVVVATVVIPVARTPPTPLMNRFTTLTVYPKAGWRNGSASDSRSEGYPFKSGVCQVSSF